MLQLIELSKCLYFYAPVLHIIIWQKNLIVVSIFNLSRYSLILMDVLYQMMRETHLIKRKVVLLTRNAGHSVLTLVSVIINNLPNHKSGDVEVGIIIMIVRSCTLWCSIKSAISTLYCDNNSNGNVSLFLNFGGFVVHQSRYVHTCRWSLLKMNWQRHLVGWSMSFYKCACRQDGQRQWKSLCPFLGLWSHYCNNHQ